jgi:mono/diheme cytochrome c family protein
MTTYPSWARPLVAAGVVVIVGLTAACQRTATATETAAARLERGAYLVEVTGCGDCHTPLKMGPNGPQPDAGRALSGHPEGFTVDVPPNLGEGPWLWAGAATNTAFAGPWGISYAPNLTPDEETGIGIWTEEMFVNAMRQGKKFGGGRPLNPPMPWPAYSHLTDEDLQAMFAYLTSLKPIRNHVPDWKPPQAAG